MNTSTFWIVLAVWLYFGSAGIQQSIRGYRSYHGRRDIGWWTKAVAVFVFQFAWHAIPAGIVYLICRSVL